MAYSKFNSNNFNITVSDGNTIPSTDIFGDRTYVDIGSGTVLKLSWTLDYLSSENKLDYYTLYIDAYNSNTGATTRILDNKIGNVKEFYITSSILSKIELSKFQLKVYLKAHSIYGEAYSGTSNILTLNIARGCGTYLKVSNGDKPSIMKRALAFTRLNYVVLTDADGRVIKDSAGKILYVKAARTQDTESGWTLMQEFFMKDLDKTWKKSDIEYEMLTDADGEIITDQDNEPIYVL